MQFSKISYILILIFMISLLLQAGCKRHRSSGIIANTETGEADPVATFIPFNPGTVIPNYGKISGGNLVRINFPVGFEPGVAGVRVFFGDVDEQIQGNEGTDVVLASENQWFLECLMPPSFKSAKCVADVVLYPDNEIDPDPSEWPPAESVTLKNSYTYIDPMQTIDFSAREIYQAEDLTDITSVDYDNDGWIDIASRHIERPILNLYKNDMGNGFYKDKAIQLIGDFEPASSSDLKYPEGILVGKINSDDIEDIVVFRQHGFSLLLNNPDNPGEFTPLNYEDKRRGKAGDLADVNGDGRDDLILSATGEIWIYNFNPFTGLYPVRPSIKIANQKKIMAIKAEDINNDTKIDLVVLTTDSLYSLIADNSGLFSKDQEISINGMASDIGIMKLITKDMNDDSVADIIFTTADYDSDAEPYPSGDVGVVLVNQKGEFSSINYYSVPGVGWGLTGATDVVAGDGNADAAVDLFVTVPGKNTVYWFMNDGHGQFNKYLAYGVGEKPLCIISFDTNNDSISDLVVAEEKSKTLSLLRGYELINPTGIPGGYRCGVDIEINYQPHMTLCKDIDWDDNPDLIIADPRDGSVQVYKGDEKGQQTLFSSLLFGDDRIVSINIMQANSNQDDYPDLAVLVENKSTFLNRMYLYLNDGIGNYNENDFYDLESGIVQLKSGDIDNDGFVDVILVEKESTSFSIFKGDGNGFYEFYQKRILELKPNNLTLFDVDDDYDLDGMVYPADEKTLLILPSNEAGPLSVGIETVNVSLPRNPEDLDYADFNLDGLKDIFSIEKDTVGRVFLNDGSFNFAEDQNMLFSGNPKRLNAIDFNFDYAPDIVALLESSQGIDLAVNEQGVLSLIDMSPVAVNQYKTGVSTDYGILWVDANADIVPDFILPSYLEQKITLMINISQP